MPLWSYKTIIANSSTPNAAPEPSTRRHRHFPNAQRLTPALLGLTPPGLVGGFALLDVLAQDALHILLLDERHADHGDVRTEGKRAHAVRDAEGSHAHRDRNALQGGGQVTQRVAIRQFDALVRAPMNIGAID